MYKQALAVATFAAFATTPAYAQGEGRVEANGGIAWAGNKTEAFAGVGGGYDFDLSEKAFVGIDLGATKGLVKGAAVVWSIGGRIGARVGEKGRIYANGGMGFCCGGSDPYIGAGYQHKFGSQVYGKIEFRNAFSTFGPNVKFAGIGLGVGF
jgi:outer membrane immunogenic protein